MSKSPMNLQDSFLNQVRKDNSEVKVVMIDGSVLSGIVRGFDNFTVILNSKGNQHLLYKHAVAQMIARKPIRRNQHPEEPAAQQKKPEGFNTMDFSQVKASEIP